MSLAAVRDMSKQECFGSSSGRNAKFTPAPHSLLDKRDPEVAPAVSHIWTALLLMTASTISEPVISEGLESSPGSNDCAATLQEVAESDPAALIERGVLPPF